jgi:hypothetical protein
MKRLSMEILFCGVLVMLIACGGSGSDKDKDLPDKGSIAFSMVWKNGVTDNKAAHPTLVDCGDIGVATSTVDVYDGSGHLAGTGGPWSCDVSSGIISGIEPGTNYTVEGLGMDGSGDVLYRGSKTGITVVAGQTTNAGEIVFEYARPTVSITSPEDGSNYQQGDTISFTSTWDDLQDGTLPDDSLVWTSSLDGRIGTGTSVTKDDLSAGTHTITFTVTDSHGDTDSDSVNVLVKTWSQAVRISPTGTNVWMPRIALNNTGDAIITWSQSDGDGCGQIFKAERRSGGPWEFPKDRDDYISIIDYLGPDYDPEDAGYPQVAIDDNGRAIITWEQDMASNFDDLIYRFLYRMEYKSGDGWGSPRLIGGDWIGGSQVALGNNGNGIIGWGYHHIETHNVLFTESRAGGSWTHFNRIMGHEPGAQRVAVNDEGNGILVWCDLAEGARSSQVYYIEYRNNGDWTDPSGINPSERSAGSPRVAMSNGSNGNGDGIITWLQSDGGFSRIYCIAYRDGGDWTANPPISPSETDAYNHHVAVNDNGNAIIVWEQDDDTASHRISLSEYRNGGSWSTPAPISPDGAEARNPHLLMNNNDDAIITWCQYDDTGNGQRYFTKYRNGYGWSTPASINPSGVHTCSTQVVMNDNGDAIITWLQSDGDDRMLYMSELQ